MERTFLCLCLFVSFFLSYMPFISAKKSVCIERFFLFFSFLSFGVSFILWNFQFVAVLLFRNHFSKTFYHKTPIRLRLL